MICVLVHAWRSRLLIVFCTVPAHVCKRGVEQQATILLASMADTTQAHAITFGTRGTADLQEWLISANEVRLLALEAEQEPQRCCTD